MGNEKNMGLYLQPGYLPLIRRCVGVLLLGIVPVVYRWSHGGSGPYLVPTWRWQDHLFSIPPLPPQVDATLWLFYVVSAFSLIFVRSGKAPVVLSTLLLALFASQDLLAANCSFVALVFTYLIGLWFANDGPNCSRRLIQISVTLCYLFSVLRKLISYDWMSGQSMHTLFVTGHDMRPPFVSAAHALSTAVPDWGWAALAWSTLVVELFIAIGLWFPKTRKAAIAVGILFHAGLTVLFGAIEMFALAMWTGYLAFVPKKGEEEEDHRRRMASPSTVKLPTTALATAWIVLMLLAPLRIFCWFGRPADCIGFFDGSPWSYGMFLFLEKTEAITAQYQDARGNWHDIPFIGRMRDAASDNELLALSEYVMREHPDAVACKVEARTSINGKRGISKTLRVARNERPVLTVATSSPDRDFATAYDHKK